MGVGIAPVFMEVGMNERHVRPQRVEESQVIIARRGAEVGVAQVEAHADVREAGRVALAQHRE